jgi:hypothetical protein
MPSTSLNTSLPRSNRDRPDSQLGGLRPTPSEVNNHLAPVSDLMLRQRRAPTPDSERSIGDWFPRTILLPISRAPHVFPVTEQIGPAI